MDNRHLAILLLAASAFVFFVIGSCLPGWVVFNVEIETVNNQTTNIMKGENSTEKVTSKSQVIIQLSVWFVQVCVSGNCQMKTWAEARQIKGMRGVNSIGIIEYRIEGAIIFAFSFAAICVAFANARIRKLSLQSEATAAIILAIEVLTEAVLLIRVSGAHTDTEKDIKSSPNVSLEYAYALLIVGLSLIFSCVGVFFAGMGACKVKKPGVERLTNIDIAADVETNGGVHFNNATGSLYNLNSLNSIPEEPAAETDTTNRI